MALLPPSNSSELIWQSAGELARRIATGEVSSVEVVEAHIRRIEAINARLNAVVVPVFDQARAGAIEADRARAAGAPLGPLHGVPITLKECFHVAGTTSAIGVDCFRDELLPTDGPLVQRLRRAGAIILGKTNVPQAMLLHETDSPLFGPANNPWNLARSPGGSSGGEAALIAAGGSPLGLANDLGGSIRQPAHVTGICGIKSTAGRFTNSGCRGNISGLKLIATQSGPLARHVADLYLALRVLADHGPDSPHHADEIEGHPIGEPNAIDVAKLKIGMFEDDGFFKASPAIRRAVREAAEALKSAGVEVVPFQPADIDRAMGLYFALIGADGGRALGDLLKGSRIDSRISRLLKVARLGPPWRQILAATASLLGQPRSALLLKSTGRKTSEQMTELAAAIDEYSKQFFATMDTVGIDALLFPPYGLPAPLHNSTLELPPAGSYCFLANLTGMPAGSVPVTQVRAEEESDRASSIDLIERAARRIENGSTGLPIGVQVAARPWREDLVLAIMQQLESAFRQHDDDPARPPI